MELIIVVVLIILVFGGGFYGHRTWGPTGGYGIGIGGLVLLLVVLWLLFGHGRL